MAHPLRTEVREVGGLLHEPWLNASFGDGSLGLGAACRLSRTGAAIVSGGGGGISPAEVLYPELGQTTLSLLRCGLPGFSVSETAGMGMALATFFK
jgi:hypothetical protein